MTEPQRENWPNLLGELHAAGITYHTVAKMMGCQFVQVQRWASGVEPKHHDGERLKAIHAEYVPRGTLQIEVTERSN
jgi:hypothetical protein